HDRAAQRDAVLLFLRAHLPAGRLLGGRGLAPVVGSAVPEELAAEIVGARTCDGGDARAAELVVLGLVVGGDHLVFGNAQLRERIAATWVLSGDAALEDVDLLPDTIDEDVDATGQLRPAAQRGRAFRAGAEGDTGHDVGERQEVALGLRQRFDLPLRDSGRDLRGLSLQERLPGHHHCVQVGRLARSGRFRYAADAQVERGSLPDRHSDVPRARLATGVDVDAVRTRRQACEVVAAVRRGLHAAGQAGCRVGCSDLRVCRGRGVDRDLAADRRGRGLREGGRAKQYASGQGATEQAAVQPVRGGTGGLALHRGAPPRAELFWNRGYEASSGETPVA